MTHPPTLVEVTMNLTLHITPLALAQFLLHANAESAATWGPGLMDAAQADRIEHPAQEELPLNADELPPLTNAPQAAPETPVEAPAEAAASDRPAPAGRRPRAKEPPQGKEALTVAIQAQAEGRVTKAKEVAVGRAIAVAQAEAKPNGATPGKLPPSEEELRALLVVLANKAPGRNAAVIALLEEIGGAPKLLACPVDTWPAIAAAAQSAIEVYGG